MSEAQFFADKYRAMYRAMIAKDANSLSALLSEDFVLEHMTGMRQDRESFFRYLKSGTLNYFSEEMCDYSAHITGDIAHFIGKSLVNAAVFGGGRHTWRLQLEMNFIFVGGDWLIREAVASTW